MSTRIEDLAPEMQARVRNMLAIVNIPYVVTSTLRTVDEQLAYYAQGRAKLEVVNALRSKAGLRPIGDGENAGTITKCDGVITKSNHQGGRAVDIVPADAHGNPVWPPANDPRWEQLGKFGEAVGLVWGGRWIAFPDRPHFESIGG